MGVLSFNFEMLAFQEGGKPEYPRETLGARWKPTPNSTHIWHRAGIEPRPHWREGERSHHCANPAPLIFPLLSFIWSRIFFVVPTQKRSNESQIPVRYPAQHCKGQSISNMTCFINWSIVFTSCSFSATNNTNSYSSWSQIWVSHHSPGDKVLSAS